MQTMINEKCIITFNVGDTNKFIFNNQNGILLNKTDINKLPETIIESLNNDKKCKDLDKRAKIFADKNFWTWKQRIDAEILEIDKLTRT